MSSLTPAAIKNWSVGRPRRSTRRGQATIPRKVLTGQGKRAVWTETVLGLVPPGVWSTKLPRPAELIETIRRRRASCAAACCSGATRAAAAFTLRFASRDWLRPPGTTGGRLPEEMTRSCRVVVEPLQTLLAADAAGEPRKRFSKRILQTTARDGGVDLLGLLSLIPRPWSAAFAGGYLGARERRSVWDGQPVYQWATFWGSPPAILNRGSARCAQSPGISPRRKVAQWHSQAITRGTRKFTETVSSASFFEGLRDS